MQRPIFMDCDPGHDDAIALILALACPELKLLGVSTSAGNQTQDKTSYNALRILTLLNRPDIPVARGAHKPLARSLIIAENVHGESGLDGPKLPEPSFALQPMGGVALMAQKLAASEQPVTLVPTGPLTNVALLLATYPHLHEKIERIVLMGGSAGPGNWSAAAEFNIYVDPEAANMVFQSGLPITMCGLDVTHQAQLLRVDIERIRALNNPVAVCVAELLDYFIQYHEDPKWGFQGAPLHDPCTIAYLAAPALFHSVSCFVAVETQGQHTSGMTVVDRYGLSGQAANAEVLLEIDRQGFVDWLVSRIASYS